MYASTASGPTSQPTLIRLLVMPREYRNPRTWARIRAACGIFNLAIGVLLLVAAPRLGLLTWLAALPLAGAALIFWTVYHLQHSIQN